MVDAQAYFSKAFEFNREFLFKWSVNWQFLGEQTAMSPVIAKILLAAHLSLLIGFLLFKWTHFLGGFSAWLKELRLNELWEKGLKINSKRLNPYYVAVTMFTCNFFGIICARSLHFQFYSWYFHSLPLLLLSIKSLHIIFKIAILVVIELCWNIFPPRGWA
eukprot:CAMPEP_0170568476 /NCGR_PEP_ID=MMETSP0211-20121228/81229_1 /TAXON_ID=311385 /ORGANISM="Pseudokeronopsis sp., Strain OXSARD2" /LENGTH=160 /DNA_ID=CAMNT_0010890391 /DNA_START=406 /DNA_END=884 /DNA_ORIENTATION=-